MLKRYFDYHPTVQVLLVGTLVLNSIQSMCGPFLAVYLGVHVHMALITIGVVIGVRSVAGTFGGLVGGVISDKLGRVRVMIASLMIQVVIYTSIAMVTSKTGVCVLLFMGGFFGAFFGPTSRALIADLTPALKRMHAFSAQYLFVNVGYAIGPLVGVALGLAGGTAPFVLMAASYGLYAISIVFVTFRLEKRHPSVASSKVSLKDIGRTILRDKVLFVFILAGMLATTVNGQWSAPMSQVLTQDYIGGLHIFAAVLTTNAVTVIALQPLLAKWTLRWSPITNLVVGGLLFALGQLVFACASGLTAFVVGMAVFTAGEILVVPAEYMIIDQITPPDMRGAYYGARSLADFGNFIGPFLFSTIFARFGTTTMFLSMAVVSMVFVTMYIFGNRTRQSEWRGLPVESHG